MSKAPKTPVKQHSFYRADRVDTFAWQAVKITREADGTYTETPVFKPDVFELVIGKITRAIKEDGQADFLASKKKEVANG